MIPRYHQLDLDRNLTTCDFNGGRYSLDYVCGWWKKVTDVQLLRAKDKTQELSGVHKETR
jgi:hypothetical protein